MSTLPIPVWLANRVSIPCTCCRKFRSLPHSQRIATLKEHGHCINCLKPGHSVKHCPCGRKCRKCQKSHHTWLHTDTEVRKQTKRVSLSNQTPYTVTHHSHLGGCHPVVLTMCQVQIVSTNGSTTKARAMLDSVSSTSFITKSLAQCLYLRRWHHFMNSVASAALQPDFPHADWWISIYEIIMEGHW